MSFDTSGIPLVGRSYRLVVGIPNNPSQSVTAAWNDSNSTGRDISGLDFDFEVQKTLKPEPNTCAVKVINLSETSRKLMSGSKKLTVSLEAGYHGGTSLLYLGEVRTAWTERQGPDFITHLESGDGEKEIQTARLNVPRGAKVPAQAAVNAIVQALGLGGGNVAKLVAGLQSKGITTINGGALTGAAALRLTDLTRSAGLTWSIQNGAIQILDTTTPLSTTQALEMSSETGLVESPTVDNQGIVSAKCLITPGLLPGVLVKFDSLFVTGGYRVERVHWNGSTYGQDWTASFEAKKY